MTVKRPKIAVLNKELCRLSNDVLRVEFRMNLQRLLARLQNRLANGIVLKGMPKPGRFDNCTVSETEG